MGEPCWSIVKKPKGFETTNEITLKRNIEGDDLHKCRASVEELLQNLLDGEKFPTNLMMPVINRYQMNRFTGGNRQDKRIKKLLYMLWECLPKRGPDGKFLDKMVMVCGAFDKDLKHPNQYVCGSVLRTLSKTREPEVITELVHSIEKCLEWSHAYQRKNAVLAIARIYKNFPDISPQAPQLISEYLSKENDDECKRAALQALLEIAPEEAKSYLHSCNISDIHCMNTSIQLLFVELIERVFEKGSEDSETYIKILTSLIKSSSSPSVRYQASIALMRFSRDPENIKLTVACFIDICAKDPDNNVKLIALNSLMNLRRINGAERILRNSIMDILYILQSASDLELDEKILKLSLDLLSPLNVGGVITALKHEIKKIQDKNSLGSQQETLKYRRLLVDAVHKIADRFPSAIMEFELLDPLFELLLCNSINERTSSNLISLFQVFMSKNPSYQEKMISKIQESVPLAKNNVATQCGLIQLLGDFSESKKQIEKSYRVIKDSLGELPFLASEKRKELGDGESAGNEGSSKEKTKTTNANGEIDAVTKSMSRLVTADGSYATQSAISYQNKPEEEQPSLRSFYLKNNFSTAPVLGYTLLKMACRYRQVEVSEAEFRKMIARFMFMIASILNYGHSNLVDAEGNPFYIGGDHTENLLLCLNVLQHLLDGSEIDITDTIKKIVTHEMRSQLGAIVKNIEQERLSSNFSKKSTKIKNFDDKISISLLSSKDDDIDLDRREDDDEDDGIDFVQNLAMRDMFEEIPLTGTLDPIYAYCKFNVNRYDIGLDIYLENRAKSKTFENVTLELVARGDTTSRLLERPESIVLAPRATACIRTNVKVVSVENRRLFGSITFDDVHSDDKEQVITLNDISVNVTDYIMPSWIGFEDFRDIWRDCEWENKVIVRTKLTNLKEYLSHLVAATNMRCVTADRSLTGECSFLSANLYAKSSFGEEALVNVSIEKSSPTAIVTGTVKIRSRSQGMALSLGEKISTTQSSLK